MALTVVKQRFIQLLRVFCLLFQVVAMEAGTITSDMRFNMDLNQQRFQANLSTDGQSYSVYADLKDVRISNLKIRYYKQKDLQH